MSEHSHLVVNRQFSSGYVTVLLLVLCCIGLALLSTPAQGWMFRSDLTHSGVYDDGGIMPNNVLRWSYTTDDEVYSSPAVADGVVYVGSADGFVYAFDALTGDLIWSRDLGYPVYSSPAVADGVVYVGCDDNYVYALDATNLGVILWRFMTYDDVESSPAVADGVVYVGSVDGYVYALDATTGLQIWNYQTWNSDSPLPVYSSPAVVDGVVYVGCDNGYVYALDATNLGALLWRYVTWNQGSPSSVYSSPAVADGIVYVGCDDGYVYALDATTNDPAGHLIWKYSTGGAVDSSPAVADGVVYIGSEDGYLYALDAKTGDLIWRQQTVGEVYSSPAVANGVVYIGSEDSNVKKYDSKVSKSKVGLPSEIGYVYAFDATNSGELLWRYQTDDGVESSPAVANGVVYVGCEDNNVYAIGTNPVPTITSLNPNPVIAGGSTFILTITGTNYISQSEVHWNSITGPTLTILSQTATQIQVTVPASYITNVGSFEIYVVNPAPGGGSAHATLTVVTTAPCPRTYGGFWSRPRCDANRDLAPVWYYGYYGSDHDNGDELSIQHGDEKGCREPGEGVALLACE
jgi:outer membrane protein assembly factor BamB